MAPPRRQLIRRVPPNIPRDVAEWGRTVGGRGPTLGGGMGAPTPGAGLPTPDSLSQIVFPPWVFPPGNAGRYIFEEDVVNLGPGPVVSTELAGTIFNVPQQNVAVIREINLNVNNLLTTSNIVFRLLFNSGPVEGYDDMRVFPRAASSVSIAFPAESTIIHVPEGARISLAVEILDAGSYQLGASHRGWFYSKDVAKRYHTI